MARLFVCLFVALTLSAADGATITNAELLDLITENADSDGQELHVSGPVADDVELTAQEDVIDLPGGPDDEADIETLMDKLGLLNIREDDQFVGGGCSCQKDSCTCCIGKTITLRVGFKTIRTSIHACVTVSYVPSSTTFMLKFTLNGKTVYHKEVSLHRPPRVCAKMSGRTIEALVCLEIYNVNISNKSLCTRLIGIIDFKIKKLVFRWGIGCFKIPAVSGQPLLSAEPSIGVDEITV